jgi:hypothetical protein
VYERCIRGGALTAASQTAHSGDGGEGRRRRGEQTWASSSSSGGCCTHLSKSRGNASSSGGTLLVALASDVALTAPPARLRGPTRRICSLAHPVPALPLPSRRRPTLTAPHRVHSTPTRPAVETARCRTPGGGATDALTPRALSCAVPAMPAIPLRPTKVRLVVLGPASKNHRETHGAVPAAVPHAVRCSVRLHSEPRYALPPLAPPPRFRALKVVDTGATTATCTAGGSDSCVLERGGYDRIGGRETLRARMAEDPSPRVDDVQWQRWESACIVTTRCPRQLSCSSRPVPLLGLGRDKGPEVLHGCGAGFRVGSSSASV